MVKQRINSKKFAQELEADFGLKSPPELKSKADKDSGKVAAPAEDKLPGAAKVPAMPAPKGVSPPLPPATPPAPKAFKFEGSLGERGVKSDLSVGRAADICLFDPEEKWRYDAKAGFSKSSNSPWSGQTLTGRVKIARCASSAGPPL